MLRQPHVSVNARTCGKGKPFHIGSCLKAKTTKGFIKVPR